MSAQLSGMFFRRFDPPPALAPWVECLWTLRMEAPAADRPPERILPDGCMELVVNLRAPVRTRIGQGPAVVHPAAALAGQISRVLLLEHLGVTEIVAARFRPLGAAALFGFGLAELADREVALADLGEPWRGLEARLQEAKPEARLPLLTSCLLGALRQPASSPLHRAVDLIRRGHGIQRVEQVARAAGFSPRQLERRFLREVGLAPKQFSRIVRFQHLIRSLPKTPDWAAAAGEAGLTDQAHLVREFREFTGLTPTAWLAGRTPMGEAMRE